MKLLNYAFFYILVFSFHFASAMYTCNALFAENVSFEQQYKSVVEDKKVNLLRDIPVHSDDFVNLSEIALKPGQEFLVRVPDLMRVKVPTFGPDVLTHDVDNIRHLVIKIENQVEDRFLIRVPELLNTENTFWVSDTKLLSLKGLPIQFWDRRLVQTEIKLDLKPEEYKIKSTTASVDEPYISIIKFIPEASEVYIEDSRTLPKYQQNYFFSVLLKKYISDHPEVSRFSASLGGTNYMICLEVLHEAFTGKKIKVDRDNSLMYATRISKLAKQKSPEELNIAVQKAIRQTPLYFSMLRFGFSELKSFSYDIGPDYFHISLEVIKP